MTLHVLVIDEKQERCVRLHKDLIAAGYRVTASTVLGDVANLVSKTQPDVIIIDMDSPNRDVLEHIVCIQRNHPRPMVLFTHDDDSSKLRAAVQAGVSAYVTSQAPGAKISPVIDVAIAQYREYAKLQAEVGRNQALLAERKLIERAKGILMQQRGCSEEEAYRLLRKMAMDRKTKMAEIARSVVSVAGLLVRSES